MNKEIKIGLFLVGALFCLFFLNKILRRTGIFKSKRKKEVEENLKEIRTINYFNPVYKNSVTGYKEIADQHAVKSATIIRKAVRGFGTKEENIFSVFQNLYNKVNISQIAEKYFMKYKRDMKADILRDLNKKEKSTLMNIINQLPDKS